MNEDGASSYGIFQGSIFGRADVYRLRLILALAGYYTSHPPFEQAPRLVIGAVGPVTIAFEYVEVSVKFLVISRLHRTDLPFRDCFSRFSTYGTPITSKPQCGSD